MADDTSKVKAKANTLANSLSQLESTLEPLFAKSLPETTLGLDTIQQAKLQVAIPYLVYDLVFSRSYYWPPLSIYSVFLPLREIINGGLC